MENKNKRILITGAFGFVGSNLVKFLNTKNIIPYVDDLKQFNSEQWKNVAGLRFISIGELKQLNVYDAVVHLGANVDTTEKMSKQLWENNFEYSTRLLNGASKFIYASSASVYGGEERDFTERTDDLKPLNAYAFTKLAFDQYLEDKIKNNIFCRKNNIGLRFFNVYGPNESHKGNMASVVHKALHKLYPIYGSENGMYDGVKGAPRIPCWQLFKSYKSGIANGEQKRDFVYVEDVCKVIWFFIENEADSGFYNLGSGKARSFNDLVNAVDPKLPKKYMDMPDDIKNHYQYFTQADLRKLRAAGYKEEFTSLEDGIRMTKKQLGMKEAIYL